MLLFTESWYGGKSGDSGEQTHSKNPWKFSEDGTFTTLKYGETWNGKLSSDKVRGTWTYDDEMLKLKWDRGLGSANFKINWVSKPESKFTFECVDSGWSWMKEWTLINQDYLKSVCAKEMEVCRCTGTVTYGSVWRRVDSFIKCDWKGFGGKMPNGGGKCHCNPAE